VAVLALVGAGLGWQSWSFMQHDNEFCQSCHVMDVPFEKFTTSEHSKLQCHDCHQQPISASIRQVYLWVLDRPEDIGEHAPVPNTVCGTCHIQQHPDSVWQRIVATAGHRVHLESDSLPDLMCVKCHGIEVHRFVPVDQTCGQSGCHEPEKTQIVLGSMAGQNDLHCVACHRFTAPVTEEAALDTARAALVPHQEQCFSCHQMRDQLVTFDPELEPHDAVCGTCHDPHTQESPELADESCASSSCHANADTLTPFHRGLAPDVASDCVGCHRAHTFLVEGENCAACHANIAGARRQQSERTPRRPASGLATAVPGMAEPDVPIRLVSLYVDLRDRRAAPPVTRRRSAAQQIQPGFDHASHSGISCTDCHAFDTSHGAITPTAERGCMECHHTAPVVNRGCETCHATSSAPRAVSMAMRLGVWSGAQTREVRFDHDEHSQVACATCHTEGTARAVSTTCATCHTEHHAADTDCTRCHAPPSPDAHTIAVHTEGCAGSGCHEDRTIAGIPRTRSFCLSCHQDMEQHEPGRNCATCHQVPDAGGRR
jgi:nitrate/TMAO reductase-like tetraheme cytochrome c subunit